MTLRRLSAWTRRGIWALTNAAADQAWSLSLNVGNTTNYLRNLGYQARAKPKVLEVSLSRWALDAAPRLRLGSCIGRSAKPR